MQVGSDQAEESFGVTTCITLMLLLLLMLEVEPRLNVS
jgi:hypothetical protein